MKNGLITIVFIISKGIVFSQNQTGISGRAIDIKTQKPLPFVVISVQNTNLTQLTDTDGQFVIEPIDPGKQLILIRTQGYKEQLFEVSIIENQILNLGDVFLEEVLEEESQTNTIRLFDTDLTDDNSSTENTSDLLLSSKDAFQQAAAFNWGQTRFKIRGLDSEQATTMINGVVMNKRYDGRPQWNNWGGLTDATRNQEFTVGTAPSDYSFGGILGTQEINTRASAYKSGTKMTFSGTNANYNWRSMITYASGMGNKGWALVFSVGKRFATEAYFEGTNYDANSVFISVEKKVNDNHALNFTGFYTPNSRAKNSPNTDEVTQLTSEKYNSYWGFQGGKKRNSRVKTIEEPILMFNHFYKINERTNLSTSLMYQFGNTGNTNIDYQNVNSPDPAYYRKLPSYYSSLYATDKGEFSGDFIPDYENAEKSRIAFLTQPQLDWEALYRANQLAVIDQNGVITEFKPAQSRYVWYEDRTDDNNLIFNSNFSSELSEHIILNAGLSFDKLTSHNYQKLLDLLGGSYFLDIDPFYKGSQAQSDLNNPNRRVGVGEIYGYNYNLFANSLDAFTQFRFNYNKVAFYLAQSFSSTQYQREGLYKNGIYESLSFGKSDKIAFENFGFKGGLTYKISGKQTLTFNAAHTTKAPTMRNAFFNARLNNAVVEGLENEKLNSLDLNYFFRSSKIKARITLYFATIKNATRTSFFYADGIFDNGAGFTNTNGFVSQTLSKLDKKNTGSEFSLEYQLSPTITAAFSAAYGQYIYDSNPKVSINNDALATVDNTNPSFDFGTALLKNYYQAGTPQQAVSLGVEYRNPKYWRIGANINYLAESYVDVSPITRTNRFYTNPVSGFPFPEATEDRAAVLLKQEKLNPVELLNITAGKNWRIKGTSLGLFASINNVLNATYKTGGYEQARNANYRQLNQDLSSGTPSFGNKYFYGYGRTYFVNLSFSF